MSRVKHILSYAIPIAVLLFFLFGSLFAPHDPTATNIRGKFLTSSAEYPFGTDDFGRCEFSRILEGGKTTLGIVLVGSAIVIVLGILFGILLAKTGRRRNILAESILNAVTAIPPVAYLIIFIGIWGNSIPTMLVALTASLILRMIKLVKTLIEVSKASVSYAVTTLRQGGFLTMEDDFSLHLTDVGREVAERVYEKHRFFFEMLTAAGVEHHTAQREACRMEHTLSEESFQKLKQSVERKDTHADP